MKWSKPDFKEINLSGEVTAYVNTDDARWERLEETRVDSSLRKNPLEESQDATA